MTEQIRRLPESDQEVYMAYLLHKSYAEVARVYGCNESAVRKRVKKFLEEQEWDQNEY